MGSIVSTRLPGRRAQLLQRVSLILSRVLVNLPLPAHPDYLEKLVIINAPHPGIFGRELARNPAQQKASQYMLMFRGEKAEETLSANNYGMLVGAVLGSGLKSGVFTEDDKKAYIEAWSKPGALTGGLNYYRAARVGPPAGEGAQATSCGRDTPISCSACARCS